MKKIIRTAGLALVLTVLASSGFAQKSTLEGWHLKDLQKDGLYGISLDQAYDFLKSKGLKSTPVIVGVIDSGIDTTHEDLKPVLWVNPKEIPGNGIDDDKNGYIDDIHGWNFLGSRDGKQNVTKDSYEAARVYWQFKSQFEGKTESQIAASDKQNYQMWKRAQADIDKNSSSKDSDFIRLIAEVFREGDSIIKADLKKEIYSCKDLANYTPLAAAANQVRQILVGTCQANGTEDLTNKMLSDEITKDLDKATLAFKAPENYRANVVKDNYGDLNDRYYGNGNLLVDNESAMHGTHVAGIIGAVRNNGVGMDGVADNVRIMSLRAVPDGDEHDKDIALAIRYAVDNGARVINMSFGKGFSPQKKWVDEAVKYAAGKNVLMIHAAGNDAANIDTTANFPSAEFLDGTRPENWMTIGASSESESNGLTASFSNYGKKEVDVFAPGVKIYATVPGGNTYASLQGTSMAAPVVSGLAALIMSYYPQLTAVQVKNIIEKTVLQPQPLVSNPGGGTDVKMSELSVNGGIVNAYNAVKMADAESKTVPAKKKR